MIMRLQKTASKQKVPSSHRQETQEPAAIAGGRLLTGRSAAILGASFAIAVCAGVLAYLAVGKPGANLAGAVLAAGAAFVSAIRFLDSIIA
jgi:hypothetical protein